MDKAREVGDCILTATCARRKPGDRVNAICTFFCIDNDVVISDCMNASAGVYILYTETDVLYVGQSENVKSRVANHRHIEFTEALVIYTEPANLIAIEAIAIGVLKPTQNHKNSARYEPTSARSYTCQE